MLLSNLEHVPGYRIVEHLGLVTGSTIRAKHVGRDIMAGLKNIVGGEITDYTRLIDESREQALDRMMEEAAAMGADAIVSMRFATSAIMGGAAELLAYGTAVRLEDA